MFFLNLSLGEFLTLLGTVGGLITALYLLDRSKRKKVVSTLRFWTPARSAEEMHSRRRMRDPWSLMLQLLGLLFLLLAIAQLQWGDKRSRGRDHVLLLDTSAWSAAKSGNGTVLDREKTLALSYLGALPASDRVLVLRADGLTTPVTPFTANRNELRNAIAAAKPEASALNLEQAFAFAAQAQKWAEGVPGDIVYIGPRIVAEQETGFPVPANLRVLSVDLNREHVGIRHLTAKRLPQESGDWEATVTLKNYGALPHTVLLQTHYGGTSFATRRLDVAPHQEAAADYHFSTNSEGDLVASVTPHDDLVTDQEARLHLPRSGRLPVAVYTSRPQELRPLLEANRGVASHFLTPAQYPSAADHGSVVVLDEFAPPAAPNAPSLWINPPRDGSPIAVKGIDYDAVIKNWHNENALGAGLHAKETHLAKAEIFEAFEGDIPVANTAGGPIVIARDGSAFHKPRLGIIGFDPLAGQMKFEVTTPILFANFLRWLAPEAFRNLDLSAGSVGAATLTLDPNERTDQMRVVDDKGLSLPFSVRAGLLELYTPGPAVLHVYSTDRERILSLTLPQVAETLWPLPATASEGLPRFSRLRGAPRDLWKWLALAGLACLCAEWFWFGRQRRAGNLAVVNRKPAAAQREPELVGK